MASLFSHMPEEPRNQHCQLAYTILCKAHDASSSFLDTFNTVRRERNARGTATDEEQDLLRAMLVFASAGLDSLVKQLVKDALPALLQANQGAITMFKTFVERRIRSREEIDHRLLADVLADKNPKDRLVFLLVEDLTSRSLQSTEEILKIAAYFDIPSQEIASDPRKLTELFSVRNQIAHEMDVDFLQSNRNRRPRARNTMKKHTNEVFRLSKALLEGVDSRIPSNQYDQAG